MTISSWIKDDLRDSVGFDYHTESITRARKSAAAAGVSDRCRFEVTTAQDYPGTGYGLVTVFDALQTLAPDGTWMIVEPFAHDRLEDNLNPVGRVFTQPPPPSACPCPARNRSMPASAPRPARPVCAKSSPRVASPASGGSPKRLATSSSRRAVTTGAGAERLPDDTTLVIAEREEAEDRADEQTVTSSTNTTQIPGHVAATCSP